jgi:CRP-like cAMP-binding protein
MIQFRAGTDFERVCPEAQQVGLVAQGIVARFEESEEGGRQDTAVFVSGDMFGLHRLAFPQTNWRLTAFTPCSVLFIPMEDMQQLATRHPALERAFWRDMAIDASIAAKWIGNLSLRNGPSRTAHLICELGMRMEAAGLASRMPFVLEVTQNRLAEAVGLTPVHLNRVLQQLRSEGVLSPSSRGIRVEDWKGLCATARFDAAYLQLPLDRYDYTALVEASRARVL